MNTAKNTKYFNPLNILYFVLGTLLVVFLLFQIDFQDMLSVILNVSPGMLVLGGLLYLCKGLVRGFRFWRINANLRPGFFRMLRLTLGTSLASQLLPLKLGELTYIYAARKDFRTTLSQSLSVLIVVRIFDMLAISLLFVLAALLLAVPGYLTIYFRYIVAFIALLLLVLVIFLVAGRHVSAVGGWLMRVRWFNRSRWLRKIEQTVEALLEELSRFRGSQYLELAGYSLLEWGVNFGMYAALLYGIGLTPSLFDPVVAVTFAALASLLPINSFGNFGMQEAGWMTGMMLLGYSRETALTSAFATHLLSLGYMLILGGAAWLSYLVNGRFSSLAAAPPVDKRQN